ncbi:MAG: small ribosomal subunit Rsm22 family protein [Chloroflexaceae bacterium]|jgi:ribosomal protein RSM22 (predicted rRNA methylase)|nr:small ribosomal subunit Rsm22 family protein [Chloroflexaceae bacterium]
MLTLPPDLESAIRTALATTPASRWIEAAQHLSLRYREQHRPGDQPLASTELDALGYAALVLPAAYAQLHGALAATAARIPGWAPTSLLDIGSGPGTALWAATRRWPSLTRLSAWEREPAFIRLGRSLAHASQSAAVREARWERVDALTLTEDRRPKTDDRRPESEDWGYATTQFAVRSTQSYDLVIIGHVLNELPPETQARVVAWAWAHTAGLLLLVEPGTPAGFAIVRAARDQLLADGAETIAPCVHNQPCPLAGDWCHFPQRLKRPEFQRRARAAPSEWEDAKWSYAAMARFAPASPAWGRVIREPTWNKAYAEVELSTQEGIVRQRALKRHRESFRHVKALEWGEVIEEGLGVNG